MPLVNGSSPAAISKNIATERNAGKSEAQSGAIAESEARRTARDMQAPLATTPNSGAPMRSKSSNDRWPGRSL